MPAPKQNLFFPVGGLETEVDDKLLPNGKLVELQNYYLPRVGRAERRFGTSNLPALTGIWGVSQHNGSLVALRDDTDNDHLDVLATTSSSAWAGDSAGSDPIASSLRGRVAVNLSKVFQTRFNNLGSVTSGDIAYGGGYLFVAGLDAANGQLLHFVAIDPSTGHIVARTTSDFSAFGASIVPAAWRLAYVNGYAVLAYETTGAGGSVGFATMQPSAAFAVQGAVSGVTSLGGNYHGAQFDLIVKDATTVMVVYPNAAGNARGLDFVPSTLAITAFTPQTPAAGDIAITSVAWMQDFYSAGRIALIAGVQTGPAINVYWDIPSSGATRAATTTYSHTPASVPYNVTGHTLSNLATGEYLVLYDNNVGQIGTTGSSWVGQATRNSLGTLATQLMYRGATLRSKTFTHSSFQYAVISYASSTDGTHYLVPIVAGSDQTVTPVMAQFAVRQGPGGCFSNVAVQGGGVFSVVTSYVARFDGGGNSNAQGIQTATITFGGRPNTTTGPAREAIGSLFVPGGQLREFDGASYSEAQFAYPPEQAVSLTPGTGSGSLASGQTYYYAFVYARMNAQGKMVRSDASVTQSVALGASDTNLTASIRPQRLTSWSNAVVEVYRGTDVDELHKVGIVANVTNADTVSFLDLVSDATMLAGENLYTTGDVLPDQTPPGFLSVAVAGNRMFGISQDDPQVVWYTKPFTLDRGLEWNEVLTFDVRDQNGPLRGLAVMDDKIIAFKDRQPYVLTGPGLDNLGSGQNFEPRPLTPGIGCSNPNGIAETRDGVEFQSLGTRAGIFQIDRSLTTRYVGSGVQRYLGLTITQAIFVPGLSQVRFYTSNGTTLVRDILSGQWSIFTGQAAYCATAWNGVAVYVSTTADRARLEVTDASVYTEAGTPYQGIISFPYIQINQLRGYERFYQVQPVGDLRGGTQNLTIELREDWNTSPLATGTASISASPITAEMVYRTKLSSLQVILTDASPTDRGLAINGITVIVAAKEGLKRSVTRTT